jgi:hypothetical protein
MCHQDVLKALDSLKLVVEPMVQLRRIFVLSEDAEHLLTVLAECQLVNCLINLTEVLHTISHQNDHQNVHKEEFRKDMDAIFKELGLNVEA